MKVQKRASSIWWATTAAAAAGTILLTLGVAAASNPSCSGAYGKVNYIYQGNWGSPNAKSQAACCSACSKYGDQCASWIYQPLAGSCQLVLPGTYRYQGLKEQAGCSSAYIDNQHSLYSTLLGSPDACCQACANSASCDAFLFEEGTKCYLSVPPADVPIYYGQGNPGASGVDDPHFRSFSGAWYEFPGYPGAVFNVLSAPTHQVNALFSNLGNARVVNNYMTRIAFNLSSSLQPNLAYVLAPGVKAMALPHAPEGGAGATLVIATREVAVSIYTRTGEAWLGLNIDLLTRALPDMHGIVGQTWRDGRGVAPQVVNGTHVVEGTEPDYEVLDGMLGTDFPFNLFTLPPLATAAGITTTYTAGSSTNKAKPLVAAANVRRAGGRSRSNTTNPSAALPHRRHLYEHSWRQLAEQLVETVNAEGEVVTVRFVPTPPEKQVAFAPEPVRRRRAAEVAAPVMEALGALLGARYERPVASSAVQHGARAGV